MRVASSSIKASPKHQQIFETLRQEIHLGRYHPGQRIPSEAALVTRFGASRITVGRAVKDLERAGLVDRKAGSGSFVRQQAGPVPDHGLAFGLLIPDLGRTEIFEAICQGMAEAPQAVGHTLLWASPMSRDPQHSRASQAWEICRQYLARRVNGVFFAPLETTEGDDHINHRIVTEFHHANIPVVLLDRDFLPYPKRSRHDLVGIDNRRAGFAATRHLLDQGCRQLVFMSYPNPAATISERMAGFREALFASGLPVTENAVRHLSPGDEASLKKIMHGQRPDGLVCANDRTAGHLMHNLKQLGIEVPRDVRIVGMDDIAYASLLPAPLTTIHQPCREIGMAAVSAMMERLARPDMPARDILLECPLVVRKSCGAL